MEVSRPTNVHLIFAVHKRDKKSFGRSYNIVKA